VSRSIEFLQFEDGFVTYQRGDIIFKEGERGNNMYVVRSGSVELRVAGKPLEILESGAFLGEMALLDCPLRSATAKALTTCELVPIDKERFNKLLDHSPFFARDIMQVMSQRLRRMNEERLLLHKVIDKLQATITVMEGGEQTTGDAGTQEQNQDLKLLVGTLIGSPEELEFEDKAAAAQTPSPTLKEQPRKGRQTAVSSKKPQK
jgi:CRP-like cAMP-binding protein